MTNTIIGNAYGIILSTRLLLLWFLLHCTGHQNKEIDYNPDDAND